VIGSHAKKDKRLTDRRLNAAGRRELNVYPPRAVSDEFCAHAEEFALAALTEGRSA